MLTTAHDWEYLAKVPKFGMQREPEKLPTNVTAEDFAVIYQSCDMAKMPRGLRYPAADWWRALIVFDYMTSWRIGEPRSLRREDVDLEAGVAITRHDDNKGKRDELVPLHPVVVDHLRLIESFEPAVFPWYHHRTALWCEFERIQKAAGIHLECREDHEHTSRCHVYGFHDFRRAFATMNADMLSPSALRKLMRHRSDPTTKRYINMADKLKPAVETLHVPPVLNRAAGG